jgi:hypothetical protein
MPDDHDDVEVADVPELDLDVPYPVGSATAKSLLFCPSDSNSKFRQKLLRWSKGVNAPSGKRVALELVRLGGRWYVTRRAVKAFLEATNTGESFQRMKDSARAARAQELLHQL